MTLRMAPSRSCSFCGLRKQTTYYHPSVEDTYVCNDCWASYDVKNPNEPEDFVFIKASVICEGCGLYRQRVTEHPYQVNRWLCIPCHESWRSREDARLWPTQTVDGR